MKFSSTELRIIEQIANGNNEVKEIVKLLQKSKNQIYRSSQKLIEKGFIERSHGTYLPKKTAYANLLFSLLSEYPSVIKPLSASGTELMTCLLEPKNISEMMNETGIGRTQIFKKLKQAISISLVQKIDEKYILNNKIWANAIDFFKELKKYEETTDGRVPGNSIIYYKNKKEIVFSNKEKIDAALTAFSAYEQYGIKILSQKIYYYLPKKALLKKDILHHSLCIVEKERDPRQIIFIALFYAKYKKEFSGIKNHILEDIKQILKGQQIPRYPKLEEIKERAEIYDIEI